MASIFVGFGSGQCFYTGIAGKQILYHYIDPGIGTLGGQPHTDQQLPGVVIIQRTGSIRVFRPQPVE